MDSITKLKRNLREARIKAESTPSDNQAFTPSHKLCPKCKQRERHNTQAYCQVCNREYQREYMREHYYSNAEKMADLQIEHDEMLRHIENIEREKCQLRESNEWYQKQLVAFYAKGEDC